MTKIRSDIFYNKCSKKNWLIYCVSVSVQINICVFVNIITMRIGQGWIIDYIGLWWHLKNGTAWKPLMFTSYESPWPTVWASWTCWKMIFLWVEWGVRNTDVLAAPEDECVNKLNANISIAFHKFNGCFSNNNPLWCVNIKSNWEKFFWLMIGNLPFWKWKNLIQRVPLNTTQSTH